ncbi:hypothetical protein ACFL5P_01240 [candidate division KSB1 bacterium]
MMKYERQRKIRLSGMTKTEWLQNQRLALQEARKWQEYIDNFFWILSSFLIAGTGYAIKIAIDSNRKDCKILILAGGMLCVWFLYMQFTKIIMLKTQFYIKIVNELEEMLDISIQPKSKKRIIDMELSKDIYPFANMFIKKLKPIEFTHIMFYIFCLSCIIWVYFIIEYFVK